jgi:hypothetical protein
VTIVALIALLVGSALGLRFTVRALIPAVGLAGVAVLLAGILHALSFAWIALAMVIATVAIQVGYLGAAVIRNITGAGRVGREQREREDKSQSAPVEPAPQRLRDHAS